MISGSIGCPPCHSVGGTASGPPLRASARSDCVTGCARCGGRTSTAVLVDAPSTLAQPASAHTLAGLTQSVLEAAEASCSCLCVRPLVSIECSTVDETVARLPGVASSVAAAGLRATPQLPVAMLPGGLLRPLAETPQERGRTDPIAPSPCLQSEAPPLQRDNRSSLSGRGCAVQI